MTFEATERGATSTFTKKNHSRILLPSDELDRKTTHSDISVFTKWQKERNISDVVLYSSPFISTS